MVLRDYLVQHYGFDDTKLKTVSLGKRADSGTKADSGSKDDWGQVRILIYPSGTAIPALKSPTPDASKGASAKADQK